LFSLPTRRYLPIAAAVAASLLIPSAALAGTAAGSTPSVLSADAVPVPAITGHVEKTGLSTPMPTTECQADLGIACYTPLQYQTAYGLSSLSSRGITGRGETILIVDPFGSPTIQADLNTFDAQFGLPATTVDIVKSGVIPPFDPGNPDSVGWSEETTLDVEYSHAVAPGAKIVLLETSVSETEGVTGFPQIMAALKTEVNKGVGDVVSMSFGSSEPDFSSAQGGYSSLLDLRYAFQDATAHNVTLVSAAGDEGAAGIGLDGATLSTVPQVSWPASDPDVTGVGGTQLYLDNTGQRTAPDTVWNDGFGAGGGGLSAVFARPGYQNQVRSVVGTQRGVPDISMSSAVNGGCWVYYSADPSQAGWGIFGGTSEATPMFSGIVALADQVAGHRLGNVNTALYALQATEGYHPWTGLIDITSGDNSFGGVTGYSAGAGYDLASGLGTPTAWLVYALAHEER
jgi:subtilase family serine protease